MQPKETIVSKINKLLQQINNSELKDSDELGIKSTEFNTGILDEEETGIKTSVIYITQKSHTGLNLVAHFSINEVLNLIRVLYSFIKDIAIQTNQTKITNSEPNPNDGDCYIEADSLKTSVSEDGEIGLIIINKETNIGMVMPITEEQTEQMYKTLKELFKKKKSD